MPQVFQVLKCYKCFVFQIHQTKKSNKFECKMCGEKQSIKRHYGIGTSQDCRTHVQKLNVLRGNMEVKVSTESDSDENEDSKIDDKIPTNDKKSVGNPINQSKWSSFIDMEKETEANEEAMLLGDSEVYLEIPQKMKRRKINVKASNSDEKFYNKINNSTVEMKCHLRLSNKNNIDNSASEKISNQDDFLENFDTNTCNNIINLKEQFSENTTILPIKQVSKNSRWAQYVDIEEDNKDINSSNSKEYASNPHNIFSLCNDNDLDEVLDI